MIASTLFAETIERRLAEPELAPGLRRIDELLPLVLARYAAQEQVSQPADWERIDLEGSASEFTPLVSRPKKSLPR